MKYPDENRDEGLAKRILEEIEERVTRPWVLMEVCGGQTHSIVNYGIDQLLPDTVELVHGRVSGLRHLAGNDRQGALHRSAIRCHLILSVNLF